MLALLGRYMQHPLRLKLRRAAGEYAAGCRLRDLEYTMSHLHSEIAEKQAAITRLQAKIADHARLKIELRELSECYARRTADGQDGGRA